MALKIFRNQMNFKIAVMILLKIKIVAVSLS
jgi:hypothetical protein